jgi:hypothetical protein
MLGLGIAPDICLDLAFAPLAAPAAFRRATS